jgi:hypothetical protein
MLSRMMVFTEASGLTRLIAQHGIRLREKLELSFSSQENMRRETSAWSI